MCGRYHISGEDVPEELRDIFAQLERRNALASVKTAGEVFPTDVVAELANSRSGEVRPFAMRWGYARGHGRPIINARSETAAAKPLFRDGMLRRRCLIPASDYFEWQRSANPSVRHALRPRGCKMFYLAGIYRLEKREDRLEAAFVILTRPAAPEIAFLHDRMPVILPQSRALDWLNPANDPEQILADALAQMEVRPQ